MWNRTGCKAQCTLRNSTMSEQLSRQGSTPHPSSADAQSATAAAAAPAAGAGPVMDSRDLLRQAQAYQAALADTFNVHQPISALSPGAMLLQPDAQPQPDPRMQPAAQLMDAYSETYAAPGREVAGQLDPRGMPHSYPGALQGPTYGMPYMNNVGGARGAAPAAYRAGEGAPHGMAGVPARQAMHDYGMAARPMVPQHGGMRPHQARMHTREYMQPGASPGYGYEMQAGRGYGPAASHMSPPVQYNRQGIPLVTDLRSCAAIALLSHCHACCACCHLQSKEQFAQHAVSEPLHQPRNVTLVWHTCRLQAALQEATAGTGQVAATLLNVAFPLRLPGLTAIMGRFTKQGRWAISLEMFQVLPALGLDRDTTVCNAALAACMRGCAWHRAKQTFNLMLAESVRMDYITYYTMLSVPRRRKLWRVVIEVCFPPASAAQVLFADLCSASLRSCMSQSHTVSQQVQQLAV